MEKFGGIDITALIEEMTEGDEDANKRTKEERELAHRHNVSVLRDTIAFNRVVADKAEKIANRYEGHLGKIEDGLFQLEDLEALSSAAAIFLMVPEVAPFYESRAEVLAVMGQLYTDVLHHDLHHREEKAAESKKDIEKQKLNGRHGRMN